MKTWIINHLKSLTLKAKAIIGIAIAYAATMSIPQAKDWISSNLGQHPTLTAWATSIVGIIAVYQNPWLQKIVNSLNVEQVAPNKVIIQGQTTAEPEPPTTGDQK